MRMILTETRRTIMQKTIKVADVRQGMPLADIV